MAQVVLDSPRQRVPLAALWRALRRWWEVRSSIRTLKQLDNRMLRDIGLDRYDIEAEVRARVGGRR
jgi:uncharacterized protein YjiS (DUF1127 family)